MSKNFDKCLVILLQIIQNLLISHLEFRTEESVDVKQYVFERNLTTIVVPLGEKLQEFKDSYLQVKFVCLKCFNKFLNTFYIDFRLLYKTFD